MLTLVKRSSNGLILIGAALVQTKIEGAVFDGAMVYGVSGLGSHRDPKKLQ